MPQHEQQQQAVPAKLSKGDGLDWIYRIVAGHSACFWVFCRKDFGIRAFEMAGPMALGVMLAYLFLAPCRAMLYFAGVWFVLLVFHRFLTLVGRWRGRRIHSAYDGTSWLVEAVIRRKDDLAAKALGEPALALLVGALLCRVSQPLGVFVMLGAASLAIKRLIEYGIDQAQLQVMRDQEDEMRVRMARYRGGR